MQQHFDPNEWRLFIDGSKTSIKAVLLHNGNVKPSVPVAFAIGLKEEYGTMKDLFRLIQYDDFKFKIVADLKVVAILMGLQGGNTKYPCFLCLWDSRAYDQHYTNITWSERNQFTPREYNVMSDPLVLQENIILPPLHIKLGLMSAFIRALGPDHEGDGLLALHVPETQSNENKCWCFCRTANTENFIQ